MNRADHLRVVDSLQVDRGDPEIRMAELALDHIQRHPFPRHLNRVRVAELMRGEASPYA